jgi:hypothetical protein
LANRAAKGNSIRTLEHVDLPLHSAEAVTREFSQWISQPAPYTGVRVLPLGTLMALKKLGFRFAMKEHWADKALSLFSGFIRRCFFSAAIKPLYTSQAAAGSLRSRLH